MEEKNDELEYIEDGHIYLFNGVIIKSVTQILHEKLFPNKYKDVPKWILENKARYGSEVHSTIEKIENNEEYEINSVYIEMSIKQYDEIKKKNKIEVISQEQVVCYKGIYAGKYDMTAKVNNENCLIDIKTTAELDKEYLSWQLSMYELAIGEKFDKLYCLWLPKGSLGKLVEINRKDEKLIKIIIGE